METQNCNPPKVDNWSEVSILEVVLSAQEGIPGAKAELARREKEGQELDKSADIEKGNPNRDPRTGQFTFGAGGPQADGGGGAGSGDAAEEDTDYRGYHTAPRREDGFGAPATDIEEMMPDFYERPNIYTTGMPQADKESVSALMRIKGKPDAPVTIYRAVPEGADEINPGDWVTLSPSYAKSHLMSNLEAGHVISQTIPASDLWFDGDSINEFGYDPVSKGKSADITKNNPNRDPRTGQFTYGAGGPQSGGGGGGSAEDGDGAESGAGDAEGAGAEGEMAKGKDITSELATEYGTDGNYTQQSADLRDADMDPAKRGDATLEDIARRQGFDGEADLVDQKTFDEVVAKGGTVTYRGITPYYDGPGPDATYIEGESGLTDTFAEDEYFGGLGVYGGGTYTSVDIDTAKHYASEDEAKGVVVTMAIKPGARIATPMEWAEAKQAAADGKGGFTGATDPGRILAAKGYDGFRILAKNVDHPANQFIVVLNRTALVVLDK
jgi:hypothetical protein